MKKTLFFVIFIFSLFTSLYGRSEKATLMDGMEAKKILKEAYSFIESQNYLSIDAITTSEDVFGYDTVMEESRKIIIKLSRPDKLFVSMSGDYIHRDYYLDHSIFTIYDGDANLYGKLKAKKSIDGTLDFLYEEYGIYSPLANLLYSNLNERVTPKAKSYYLGIRKIDNVWCHYLIFSNQKKELEVWVRANGLPIIKKFTVIDKSNPLKLHSSTTLKWNFDKIPADYFKFTPPTGSGQIPIVADKKGVSK